MSVNEDNEARLVLFAVVQYFVEFVSDGCRVMVDLRFYNLASLIS